jgi:hypothetical protein
VGGWGKGKDGRTQITVTELLAATIFVWKSYLTIEGGLLEELLDVTGRFLEELLDIKGRVGACAIQFGEGGPQHFMLCPDFPDGALAAALGGPSRRTAHPLRVQILFPVLAAPPLFPLPNLAAVLAMVTAWLFRTPPLKSRPFP